MKSIRTMQPASPAYKRALIFCLCVACALTAFSLVGCSTPAGDAPASGQAASGTEEGMSGQMQEGTLQGSITSLTPEELVIEASEDSNGYLQGLVRVDLSQIDESTIQLLQFGDTISITYSGQIGMSEPPFVSAITLEIVK